jgi:hypothetical protein
LADRLSKTILTRERIDAIKSALCDGLPLKHALAKTGTAKSSYHKWVKLGREIRGKIEAGKAFEPTEAEALLVELLDASEEGKAAFVAIHVQTIAEASKKSWQAAAWLLERSDREHYSLFGDKKAELEEEELADAFDRAAPLITAMEGTLRGIAPPPGLLPPAWTPYKWTPTQMRLLDCKKRFIALPCGRGSGKSDIAIKRLIMALAVKKPWPDPKYFFAAPTNLQAIRIGWDRIKRLMPEGWIKEEHKAEQYFETIFGSQLYVLGLDKPARIEGVQWDGGVIDESCDQRPGVFDKNVLPALTHRSAWLWRIGVPKRTGQAAAEFRKWCEEAVGQDMPDRASFSWPSSDVLPAEALAYAREHLDPRDFREQFEASWETASGGIFWAFDEAKNVRPVTYDRKLPLVIGGDFNHDPMAWCFGHRFANRLEFFDELFLRNCNTQMALDATWDRYSNHEGGFEWCVDASAGQHNTAAGTTAAGTTAAGEVITNLITILNDKRFQASKGGRRIMYPRKRPKDGRLEGNPPRESRFSATNAMLLNAAGQRRLFVAPTCTHVIDDLKARHYKPGTKDPEDIGDLGHMSDALGYVVWRFFPVRLAAIAEAMNAVIISKGK